MNTNDRMQPFRIQIEKEWELAKIIAFARAGVRNVKFVIGKNHIDALLRKIEEYARSNDVRIKINISTPDGDRKLVFGLFGAGMGAAIGGLIGGFSGAIIGVGMGTGLGIAASYIEIYISINGGENDAMVALKRNDK